jgi:heat shock protein HslJ
MGPLSRLGIAAVVLGVIAGCASAAPDALGGRTFLSITVHGADGPRELVPGTRVAITFGDDGRLSVSAGCNTMGGSYRIDGGRLRVTGGATTEMGCEAPRQAQDEWLFAFIGSGPTATLQGDVLTMTSRDSTIRLLDREVAEQDRPLVGPTWRVESIVVGNAVSSVPGGVAATLQFMADGRVQIATGCNQAAGTYLIEGRTIRLGQLTMTEIACSGPQGETERAVMAVLGTGVVTYAIDAAGLTLDAGRQGLLLRAS